MAGFGFSLRLIEFTDKQNLKVMKLEGEQVIPGRKVKRNDGSYPAPNPRHPLDCLWGVSLNLARIGWVWYSCLAAPRFG